MLEIWLKATHIAMLSVWAGGLVALPGLLGKLEDDSEEAERRWRFARLAFEFVVSPAAVLVIASGTALIFVADAATGWLAPKLVAVGAMALLHMLVGRGLVRADKRFAPGGVGRATLAIGALLCISAVLALALGKPAIDTDRFPAWLLEGRPEGFLSDLAAPEGRSGSLADADGADVPVLFLA